MCMAVTEQKKVSLLVRCPDFSGCNVHKEGYPKLMFCLSI